MRTEDQATSEAAIESGGRDYTGAVYGSLLAASVVAGTSPRHDPPSPAVLIVLLLATNLVFWLAHVHARLVGDRRRGVPLGRTEMHAVGAHEWPLVEATFPPALAVALCWTAGLSNATAAWAALLTAMGGQVTWAVIASVRSGAGTRLTVVSAGVNVFLGLIIVALKVVLTH